MREHLGVVGGRLPVLQCPGERESLYYIRDLLTGLYPLLLPQNHRGELLLPL